MGVNFWTQDDGRYSVSQFTSVNYSRTSSENSCVCVCRFQFGFRTDAFFCFSRILSFQVTVSGRETSTGETGSCTNYWHSDGGCLRIVVAHSPTPSAMVGIH